MFYDFCAFVHLSTVRWGTDRTLTTLIRIVYQSREPGGNSTAEAAEALRPLAGGAATILFALGVIGVGFLAVPIMTTGAAYDLCQVVGWKHSLHAKPSEAKKFYAAMGAFTVLAMSLNFLGFNPMRALVFSGVVQGFSTPPLLLMIMLMTNSAGSWETA